MKTIIAIVLVVSANICMSCATNANKVKYIDPTIEVKGQVDDKKIGLNDKKEIVVQEEVAAADELRIQEAVNYKHREDLEHEAFMLKECRRDLSDPRLGGSGTIPPATEIDNMKSAEEVREEIGFTDDGDLKIVRKQYFMDKLKLERRYEKSMKAMIKTVTRHREECEYKMGIARRAHGLPSQRYQGRGYFHNGVWVQTAPNENSLDDAFAIQSQEKAKAGSSYAGE